MSERRLFSLPPLGIKDRGVVAEPTEVSAVAGVFHPEWLAPAEWRIAEVYQKLFAPNRQIGTVYREVCKDVYSKSGRTVPLLALSGYRTENEELVGHLRYVRGKAKNSPEEPSPIEAMDLMSPPDGWDTWLKRHGLKHNQIAEFGRLVFESIDPDNPRPTHHKQNIAALKEMRELGFGIARKEGVRCIIAIMPEGISTYFRRGGYNPLEIEGAALNKNSKTDKLTKAYPGYWIEKKPKLYCLPVPDK